MIKELQKGRLKVKISESRTESGQLAAKEAAKYVIELLDCKDEVNIIFASAPSQNEFLAGLLEYPVDWTRINAFHMDEYIGIDPESPQSFGKFIKDRVFSKVKLKSANYFNAKAEDTEAECRRYASLLKQMPADMVFLGIGENGHLAFNDPHVAFFDDPRDVKVIDLDPACRQQQVNDGCFQKLEDVPVYAYTITIPELLYANRLFAIVPTKFKANAVKATCDGPITTECPASILRTHRNCTLYIDTDSASLVAQ